MPVLSGSTCPQWFYMVITVPCFMPSVSIMHLSDWPIKRGNSDSVYLEISTFICEVTELVQTLICYSANILVFVDC